MRSRRRKMMARYTYLITIALMTISVFMLISAAFVIDILGADVVYPDDTVSAVVTRSSTRVWTHTTVTTKSNNLPDRGAMISTTPTGENDAQNAEIMGTSITESVLFETTERECGTATDVISSSRYPTPSEDEIELLAKITYLEAGGECIEGQQAVIEVIMNRVISPDFPNSIEEVIFEGMGTKQQQFSPAGRLNEAEPMPRQYEAVKRAFSGENILPETVVFFSTKAENDRIWGQIGGHVFCYGYEW